VARKHALHREAHIPLPGYLQGPHFFFGAFATFLTAGAFLAAGAFLTAVFLAGAFLVTFFAAFFAFAMCNGSWITDALLFLSLPSAPGRRQGAN